jgi:hypothetical protein
MVLRMGGNPGKSLHKLSDTSIERPTYHQLIPDRWLDLLIGPQVGLLSFGGSKRLYCSGRSSERVNM